MKIWVIGGGGGGAGCNVSVNTGFTGGGSGGVCYYQWSA
jgi:hypothetical protein